eukprot:6212957-Pleurochrysis_carterae.AAC.2
MELTKQIPNPFQSALDWLELLQRCKTTNGKKEAKRRKLTPVADKRSRTCAATRSGPKEEASCAGSEVQVKEEHSSEGWRDQEKVNQIWKHIVEKARRDERKEQLRLRRKERERNDPCQCGRAQAKRLPRCVQSPSA